MKRRALAAALALLACLGLARSASAARVALLIGNDEGQGPDVRLRFAQSDASRLGTLLSRVGGFPSDGVVVLTGRTAAETRQALTDLGRRLRETPGEHVAVVFYSGHADGQTLHLGGSSFPMTELRETVSALPAAIKVLILDACQSGVLTRAKGGVPGQGFTSALQESEHVRGLAILAASAGSELAQESDDLGGSVFTHYLLAGLAGLADADGDGNVALGEAFDYASARTLAATMGTSTGPQHPTFRLDLEGTNDLKLTRPGVRGAGYGQLRLDVPGWYFVRRADGTIAAEIVSKGSDQLALDAGPYEITRRGDRSLEVAAVLVSEGEATPMSRLSTRPVAFGRLVRKGGGPTESYALSLATTVRTPVAELGVPFGLTLGGRADFNAWSLELRLGLGRAQAETRRFSSTNWESTLAAAALRVRDFGQPSRGLQVTGALGLEVGVSYLLQIFDTRERRSSVSPFVGPTAVAELAMGRRYFLRAAVSAPLYVVRTGPEAGEATLWRPALAAALGGGTWF